MSKWELIKAWCQKHISLGMLVGILSVETVLLLVLLCVSFFPTGDIKIIPASHETKQDNEKTEELGLISHSPEKLFPNYNAIRAYEDMNNYVVVYEKGEGICQVVVKDKNNANDIYCYEVENQHGSIHVTQAFKRAFDMPTMKKPYAEKAEMTASNKNNGM